ncbi:MAG: magnesium transporter [Gemmatimonadales bacterium]|nr:MAG: magnesium transporter [Gemmatimonadales bacterium]
MRSETSQEAPDLLPLLRDALDRGDPVRLAEVLSGYRTQALLEHWYELDAEERERVLSTLPPEAGAELLSNLSAEEQPEVLQGLTPPQVAGVLEELSPDDLADTLQALEAYDREQSEEVRGLLDPGTLAVADALTGYDEEEAGGLMTPEFISVRATMTGAQVMAFLRRAAPDAETIYYLYVVDAEQRLKGVLSLRQLIVSDPEQRVQEMMNPDIVSIHTDTDQEEVARIMADYDLSVLPVLDGDDRLVGIVTVDDVLDVVTEEATEDIHRMGAAPIDIDYARASPWLLFRKRSSWLILLVVSMTLTFNVINHYEDLIVELAILAAFIPLLIGTGGNVGAQVATLVVRALGTRELELRDYFKVFWKELKTGLLLGLAFGAFMTGYVYFFQDEPLVAVALGITMVLISLCANLVGASLPFLFRRFGIDPALTSSPGITTVMDVVGLLIYFRVVIWVLEPLLTGQPATPLP